MSQQKPSLIYTLVNGKCPRCREGDMFPSGSLYSRKFADMYPSCPCCGQTYEPEPGFYYGAMYVSFGFSTAIFLAVFLLLNMLVEEVTLAMVVGMVLVIAVGLLPIIYRLSRAVWINIFIRYEGPCSAIPKL